MKVHLILGSETPLDRVLLDEYARQMMRLDQPPWLKALDVCVFDDGQWALLLPDLGRAKASLAEAAAQMHDLAAPCSIACTMASGLAHLYAVGMREAFVFDWDASVHAVLHMDGWRMSLLPPTPEDYAAATAGSPGSNPRYHAPEFSAAILSRHAEFTPAADSWTLGTVLFELLAGKPYLDGENPLRTLFKNGAVLPVLSDLRPDLPAELCAFVMRSLERNTDIRPTLQEWREKMTSFGGAVLPAVVGTTQIFPSGEGMDAGRLTSVVTGRVLENMRLLGTRGRGGFNTHFDALLPDPGAVRMEAVGGRTPVLPPRQSTQPIMPRNVAIMPVRSAVAGASVPASGGTPATALRPSELPGADPVDCSVMAPPSVTTGSSFLVQVFLHTPDAAEVARALGVEFDPTAKRLGTHPLEVDLPPGTVVMVELFLPGMNIDEPVQRLTWKGRTTSVQFGVSLAPGAEPGTVLGRVALHLEGVPVGSIRFKVEVTPKEAAAALAPQRLEGEPHRYREAFISYSSKDRPEVLKRVQMLERFHVHFFQDVLDLEPGQRWEQELYRHIDNCDLFLLFWSQAAKDSPWVGKEVHYALDRQAGSGTGSPEIVPVLIEGPPVPLPPDHLAHLHFNDRLLYIIADGKK